MAGRRTGCAPIDRPESILLRAHRGLRRSSRRLFLAIVALTLLVPAVPARAETPDQVVLSEEGRIVVENVTYATRPSGALQLDIAAPDTWTANRPALVFVHGGGWARGSRQASSKAIRQSADLGWVGITIDYRLGPDGVFPNGPLDVVEAIRWVEQHHRGLGVDPDRIVLVGDSAGAHLVQLVGTWGASEDEGLVDVAGVVAFSGITNLLTTHDASAATNGWLAGLIADFVGCTWRAAR